MPRHMLSSGEIERVVKPSDLSQWELKTAKAKIQGQIDWEFSYYYNEKKHAVIVISPLATVQRPIGNDAMELSYEEVRCAIFSQLQGRVREKGYYSLTCALIGKGAKELHYVTLHSDHNYERVIFDSKISDPNLLLSSSEAPTLWEKFKGIIFTFFRAIQFKLGFGKEVIGSGLAFDGGSATVYRLGTQPLFDGVSCGYHTSGALITIANKISSKESYCTLKDIVDEVKTKAKQTPFDKITEERLAKPVQVPSVSSALSTLGAGSGADTIPSTPSSSMKEKATPKQAEQSETLDSDQSITLKA